MRPDPYRVMVSEAMLQQTTVETVKHRFEEFVERFPSIAALAQAPIDQVLHAWQGLGYYRRPRFLHAAAREIVDKYDGRVPKSETELLKLPGVGRYTAAAIAAIAFGCPTVPVDGNIARIVSRLGRLDALWPKDFSVFQRAADQFVDTERPGCVAQALMDLGATVCRPRNPVCDICPLRKDCRASALGHQARYPQKVAKRAKRELFAVAFLARGKDGRIQLRERPPNALLGGMMELPSSEWCPEDFVDQAARLAAAPSGIEALHSGVRRISHQFTHIDLSIDLVEVEAGHADDGAWYLPGELVQLTLPTMTKKLLRKAGIAV